MAWEADGLRMYGAPSDAAALDWAWVDEQLRGAGTYWIIAAGGDHPHPRPVWGVWSGDLLHLSIGSPVVARLVARDPNVTVHLDSSADVVIVEGTAVGVVDDAAIIAAYNEKYDWEYTVAEYGPLTRVEPSVAYAWRSAGWAGRDGIQQVGRWRFTPG